MHRLVNACALQISLGHSVISNAIPRCIVSAEARVDQIQASVIVYLDTLAQIVKACCSIRSMFRILIIGIRVHSCTQALAIFTHLKVKILAYMFQQRFLVPSPVILSAWVARVC